MRCPFCRGRGNRVLDSRLSGDGATIRRRRACSSCKRRFTTYERVEESAPMVVKKDNRREPFDRANIVAGLKKACEKRPVSMETIEQIADRIRAYERAGVDLLLLQFSPQLEEMERFGRQVIAPWRAGE